jgi:hypothetical protein
MPTFTFTNNNGFDVAIYSITQAGTTEYRGYISSRERTKSFDHDLPAGTKLFFATETTPDMTRVYHEKGITFFDTYRTTAPISKPIQ